MPPRCISACLRAASAAASALPLPLLWRCCALAPARCWCSVCKAMVCFACLNQRHHHSLLWGWRVFRAACYLGQTIVWMVVLGAPSAVRPTIGVTTGAALGVAAACVVAMIRRRVRAAPALRKRLVGDPQHAPRPHTHETDHTTERERPRTAPQAERVSTKRSTPCCCTRAANRGRVVPVNRVLLYRPPERTVCACVLSAAAVTEERAREGEKDTRRSTHPRISRLVTHAACHHAKHARTPQWHFYNNPTRTRQRASSTQAAATHTTQPAACRAFQRAAAMCSRQAICLSDDNPRQK